MTRDKWHMNGGRWEEVNPLSKFWLPSTYGLQAGGDMGHQTCDTGHLTCNMWHTGGGQHCVQVSVTWWNLLMATWPPELLPCGGGGVAEFLGLAIHGQAELHSSHRAGSFCTTGHNSADGHWLMLISRPGSSGEFADTGLWKRRKVWPFLHKGGGGHGRRSHSLGDCFASQKPLVCIKETISGTSVADIRKWWQAP